MADTHFAILDEQKLNAFHWRAIVVTGLGVFCDGYDISSIALVLTPALAAYHVTGAGNIAYIKGWLTAAALIGSMVGSLVFGALAQKGRKRFYGVDALILGIAALGQAFMPTWVALVACRFILGIGVGADYVLSPTIMAEHANRADRGKAIGLGFGTMWPIGALAAGLFYLLLQTFNVSPDLSWKLVLAGGAVPALGVIYFRRTMPESPRFLARVAADQQQAHAVMRQLAGEHAPPPSVDTRPFWNVFKQHAPHIFAGAVLWMVYDLVVYAAILFGPDIIAQNLGIPASIYQIMTELIFVIPPSILFSWFLLDRFGRKPVQVWGFAAGAVTLVLFAWMRASIPTASLMAYVVYGLFNVAQTGPGLVSGAGVYGVELAPTRIRSIAQSITVVGGRIGATIAAFVFPQLNQHIGFVGAILGLAALSLLGAVLSQLLVPETSSRSLEEINLEHAGAT